MHRTITSALQNLWHPAAHSCWGFAGLYCCRSGSCWGLLDYVVVAVDSMMLVIKNHPWYQFSVNQSEFLTGSLSTMHHLQCEEDWICQRKMWLSIEAEWERNKPQGWGYHGCYAEHRWETYGVKLLFDCEKEWHETVLKFLIVRFLDFSIALACEEICGELVSVWYDSLF